MSDHDRLHRLNICQKWFFSFVLSEVCVRVRVPAGDALIRSRSECPWFPAVLWGSTGSFVLPGCCFLSTNSIPLSTGVIIMWAETWVPTTCMARPSCHLLTLLGLETGVWRLKDLCFMLFLQHCCCSVQLPLIFKHTLTHISLARSQLMLHLHSVFDWSHTNFPFVLSCFVFVFVFGPFILLELVSVHLYIYIQIYTLLFAVRKLAETGRV